jgi:hypothetical protein
VRTLADTQTQKTDVEGYAAGTVRGLLQFIHMCVLRLPSDAYSQNLANAFNQQLNGIVGNWTFGQITDEDCYNQVNAILQQCQFYDGT